MLSSAHGFDSVAAGGRRFEWKANDVLKGGDMVCKDDNGQVVARFDANKWGKVQKQARFEL